LLLVQAHELHKLSDGFQVAVNAQEVVARDKVS